MSKFNRFKPNCFRLYFEIILLSILTSFISLVHSENDYFLTEQIETCVKNKRNSVVFNFTSTDVPKVKGILILNYSSIITKYSKTILNHLISKIEY